jgi:hypothetical protein
MAFLAKLPALEKQMLIYGVGGYSLWSLGMAVLPSKKAHAAAAQHDEAHGAAAHAAAEQHKGEHAPAAHAAAAAAPALAGPNDPMVLFALQDIQSRLSLIEKALKL